MKYSIKPIRKVTFRSNSLQSQMVTLMLPNLPKV